MKLLLGFSFREAKEFARERGWPIREERIFTPEGERVAVVLGDSRVTDCERLRGITLRSIDDIIMGPRSCSGTVVEYARRRVRPA